MIYGDCCWIDVDQLDKDRVVVLCPLAALEQHGHHLPLLTDTYLVSEVARRVEEKLGESVLLTPTLWLGSSDHHLDFPGTITVPASLYVEMIKNVLRCFVRAGFRRILFLNGHGGNIAPGQVAITEMANSDDACDDTLIAFSSYWEVAGQAFDGDRHGMSSSAVSHACEFETSMMLATRGELVHLERAKAGPPAIDTPFYHSELGGRTTVAGRFRRMTATGAMGQPQAATREKGESLLSVAAAEVVEFVSDFLTWQQPPILKN